MKVTSLLSQYLFLLLSGCLFLAPIPSWSLEKPAEELPQAGISPKLGTSIDLSLRFTDATDGVEKPLSEGLQQNIPTIIVPAYFDCPRMCGLILNGVVELLQALPLTLGKDYQVAVVSFDAREGPALASKRQQQYFERLGAGVLATASQQQRDAARASFKFFTGQEQSIQPLMNQLGFAFRRDGDEFAHSAAFMLLTPQGKISQYFTGISFPAFDVRLALVDAAQGQIGSLLDHVLLFCFRFDETQGKYVWAAFNLMRIGASLGFIVLVGLLYTLFRAERSRKNAAPVG
jgi:protein SCO1/2